MPDQPGPDETAALQPSPAPPPAPSAAIRTPDQKLRVFVSSTLQELAEERRAARAAIERLRLTPVMFELGARPHPPRDLYRAYLAQSQVFVGLYWERYGWVAPGEQVSGLEDEYLLAGDRPKLIYVKTPAPGREARLEELLGRIRAEDAASYKPFTSARELRELLADDLAVLLTERYEQGLAAGAPAVPPPEPELGAGALPVPLTSLVGRERETREVTGLFGQPDVRLVTLWGPGGIGKTRLALAAAAALGGQFRHGVRFVPLAALHEPGAVLPAIARGIGLRDPGGPTLAQDVCRALAGRELLLVLDNFEQVLPAAPLLTDLLSDAPGLRLLVTSRSPLRLSGERQVEVGPLPLPEPRRRASPAQFLTSPAVRLFVERAHAVKPDFELTGANAAAVAGICAALDGVPLALELAAARIRLLPPAAILARLDQRLPLLTGGARDLPERQQTLRGAIDWSVRLLTGEQRDLFARLGVFARGFTLEAAEAVCGPDVPDVLGGLEALVDGSLVGQEPREEEPCFSMLATVREYARELLAASGDLEALRTRHAAYYHALAARARPELRGPTQAGWVSRLEFAHDNLRAAVRHDLDTGNAAGAAGLAWDLYLYWWVAGHLAEVRAWMEEVLASGVPLPDLARAQALYYARAITFWQAEPGPLAPDLEESAALFEAGGDLSGAGVASLALGLALAAAVPPDPARVGAAFARSLALFRQAGDAWGEAMALLTLGRAALSAGQVAGARARFEESLALTRREGDQLGLAIAENHVGWTALLLGHPDEAAAHFAAGLSLSARLRHDEGVAYGLEGLLAVAARRGDTPRAARLLGASRALREQTGLIHNLNAAFYQDAVDALRSGAGAATFAAEEAAGHELSVADAVAYALGGPGASPGETHDPSAALPSPAG
ncbi:hypothetical protein DAERI_110161 [Deinococcus aerius]|uniref:Uncharacterized protein n=1 Tax=Deinococcus aerius TaxID=200253 RepID=A0A2I9CXY9_9DEIO|nr:DUF4062 domain-containing protein [Deinococcus aerius]GBF06979.1 hypothetical protein DAERI_110161 [Deinococcus aerius]